MNTKILIAGLKYIVLTALLIAACSTGNDFIIVLVVALILFFLIGENGLINKLMFAGASLGLMIGLGASELAKTIRHDGFSIDALRSDSAFFTMLMFVGIWVWVAKWANEERELEKAKNELEKEWVRIILNPNNVQEIRLHPENYRDDFKEWIKEIKPELLLPAKGETQNQPHQPE
jgi:hypothetical protein